jgi:DNA-binding SARP family transcriptional activator
MDFRLLGPLEVIADGRSLAVGGGKRRSLLALLLLHPNEVMSAERLIDELWGERPPATAAKSVHVYVSQLRRELGHPNGDVLQTRGNGYVARVGPNELDTLRFERAVAEGRRALAAGDPDTAAAKLSQAVAAWRGPPLADFAYEPFAQREIARLEELKQAALEARIDADLELGRHADLIGELETLVADHPLRERLRGQLMLALYRCGRQADALRVYREGRELLVSELGLEPGPELRALEAKILGQSPELAAPAGPPRAPPRGRAPSPARSRRPSLALVAIVVAGAALLGVAAFVALAERGQTPERAPRVALDLTPNSLAAVDAAGGRPQLALSLLGRPTDIAVADGTVWATTVSSPALIAVDARTHRIVRTLPLPGSPSSVAVDEGIAWVADGVNGVVRRVDPGEPRISTIAFHSRARADRAAKSTSVAAGAGGVWVTDGSAQLVRVDPATRAVEPIQTDRGLDGVTVTEGAVWAISSRAPAVLRIDPAGRTVTDRIDLARSGEESPFPIGIAASENTLWVLNGNTATVTAIDPRTRAILAIVPIGVDRVPNEIAASGRTAWVANEDGTLSRIEEGARAAGSVTVGESLRQLAPDGARVWVATTALDQQMPGGAG